MAAPHRDDEASAPASDPLAVTAPAIPSRVKRERTPLPAPPSSPPGPMYDTGYVVVEPRTPRR